MNNIVSIATLREQMGQLSALHTAGALGDEQYHEARATLEKRIVDAVLNGPADHAPTLPPQSQAAPSTGPSKPLLIGMALAVCGIAAFGYFMLGSPQALTAQGANAPGAAAPAPAAPNADADAAAKATAGPGHPITSAQIESMIDKLAARLKANPDDVDGWAMLGRSYAMLGKHELAAPALKRASAARPDDAALMADYADALAFISSGNLEGEPARLIAQALKLDGKNLKALSLSGTIAFNRKDYAGALRHWETLAELAPNSEFLKQIQGGIDEARTLLKGGGSAASASPAASGAAAKVASTATADKATAATPAAAGPAAISGTITLAKALAGKANPTDTLFVFARAAEGPRMPLAILRKQVKDLPLTFTLDDSMAMTPAMKLSSVQRVVVGARISKRGDATAQAGDLQGLSAPMAPNASGLKLEIAEVVGP
jgi:cytochrome c-type biogenesis protein CcmH